MVLLPAAKDRPAPRRYESGGWLRFLVRTRYQLLLGLIIAVLVPAVLRTPLSFLDIQVQSSSRTLIGTALAVLLGAYFVKRITIYPGGLTPFYALPAFAGAFALVIMFFFFFRIDYSRAQFLLSFVLAVIFFFVVLRVERRVFRQRYLVLPFGAAPTLMNLDGADWDVAAAPDASLAGFSALAVDLRADMPAEWERMVADAALRSVPVYHSKQLAESLTGRVTIEHLSENNFGSLLPSSLYLRFRRLGDILITILALPFTAAIIGVAALAIKLSEGGPIFFRQERVGYRGETFTVIKLRTMTEGADLGQAFTDESDPRITPLGRWMRRCRVDELPQIVNILRGEMSWIGPRPEAVALSKWYESQIPFYSYRHIVRPGITGWAAVNQGNVAKLEAATGKLQYDFYYIKHLSLWLDLLIVAKTLRTVVTGFGAR
ncbi:MAG: sugar transferase [Bauldia sp.]|nr:sugar transferase [Bauldia sp.]